MNFGQAIEALKNSKKVARKGWNGKGMFVYYVPAGNFKSYTEIGKSIADKDDLVHYNPYFAIKNVNSTVSTWVPSINDCLAEDWNYSAPHGAGRTMSRSKAKESILLEEYQKAMDGIFTTSVNTSTIDESPMAYKTMDEIIGNIKDTVEIVDIIKPIYNFKANE